jgi:hypothetical protein
MTRHILRHDGAATTPVKCPKCGDMIVFNGNFFCNSMAAIAFDKITRDIFEVPGTCNWALTQPPSTRQDREIEAALHTTGRFPRSAYLMEES